MISKLYSFVKVLLSASLASPSSCRERHTALVQMAPSEIPESLLRNKDEYEAYWEHYIAVKEELVEKVLQVLCRHGSPLRRCSSHCLHTSIHCFLSHFSESHVQDDLEDGDEQLLVGPSSSAQTSAHGKLFSCIVAWIQENVGDFEEDIRYCAIQRSVLCLKLKNRIHAFTFLWSSLSLLRLFWPKSLGSF